VQEGGREHRQDERHGCPETGDGAAEKCYSGGKKGGL